jgi:hypothetical protein
MYVMTLHVDNRRHTYFSRAHRSTLAYRPCRSRAGIRFGGNKLNVIVAAYKRLAEHPGTFLSGVCGGIAVGGGIYWGDAYDERFQSREGDDYVSGTHFGGVP